MWPFKKKIIDEEQASAKEGSCHNSTVMDATNWRQILAEGKVVEFIDGCKAKCVGTFEDF